MHKRAACNQIVLKLDTTVKQRLCLREKCFPALRHSWLSPLSEELPEKPESPTAQPSLPERWMAQHFLQSKAYRDFPAKDFEKISEVEAWQWFVRSRWGSLTHMPCPTCGVVDQHYQVRQRHQWRCKHCSRVFSVTSDTPFSGRRLLFKELLRLIYLFVSHPKGISANQVLAELGTTYRTAYQNLHKIREVLHDVQDRSPLSGVVQIDGGHFCGKPRRPRKRSKTTSEIANNHLKNRKAGIVPGVSRSTMEPWNIEKLKKRRIVLTIRAIGENRGDGARRTITCIVKAESACDVIPLVRKYVLPGTTIQSDDGKAYSQLKTWYRHETVRHSVEYATDEGTNNNQAEAFFGMYRRAEYGVFHGMRPEYLAFYAAEVAWRDDNRRCSLRERLSLLLGSVLRSGISRAFRGYAQGHRLGFEYLG